MKIDRLFRIMYILLENKSVTAEELSQKLEVSIRTIYRDIETLSAAGMPIHTTSGKGGGIGLLENFVLNKSTITKEEQEHIVMALENLSASEYINTDKTLEKLKGIFENHKSSWIEVDYSRWANKKNDKDKFNILKEAILNTNRIEFDYYSTYGESSRCVEPIKLIFKSRSWYLQGYCLDRQDYRIFKINRINNLNKLDEVFENIHKDPPGMENFEYDENKYSEIKLKFSHHIAYRVYDEFDNSNISKAEDGSFIVSARLPIDEWIHGYILSFGTSVEVIEPKSLRNTVVEEIRKLYQKYEIS